MPPPDRTVQVDRPEDLGPTGVLVVADGAGVELGAGLLDRLSLSRERTVAALADAGPVYGVSTGMGSLSHLAVDTSQQPSFQGDLMLGRAVGTEPWLDERGARAALAVRLRTLLDPEVGASPGLALALADLLNHDVRAAVPATGNGSAGEIIPLAHLGGLLTGRGEGLDRSGHPVPADALLRDAGLAPYTLGVKEGAAFLQGVPVATAQAILLSRDAALLRTQAAVVAAGEIALVRAPRDPYDAVLARGDAELDTVLGWIRLLAGDEPAPRMLQAPVSYRVVGPALAHLGRSLQHLDEAVARALGGVSTSPALVGERFLGTAGFDGFDLAASADAVRVALLHVAELGTARLHRLLDPRVTGLTPQLSADPGRQAGLVVLHKRAVGLLHEARRQSGPASLGASETSSGQEDVQSFALEAMRAVHASADVLRDVTACELVALHQATLLDATVEIGTGSLHMVLRKASEGLGDDASDRAFDREVRVMTHVLRLGWAHDVVDTPYDAPSRP